jgi:hypothetical protein
MWRLDVAAEADLEIFEAALRYEREREGLGFRFEAQVNAIFVRLLENPRHFPSLRTTVGAPDSRFSVRVFFTTDGGSDHGARGPAPAPPSRHIQRPRREPSEPRGAVGAEAVASSRLPDRCELVRVRQLPDLA